jgi:hypothetical protein
MLNAFTKRELIGPGASAKSLQSLGGIKAMRKLPDSSSSIPKRDRVKRRTSSASPWSPCRHELRPDASYRSRHDDTIRAIPSSRGHRRGRDRRAGTSTKSASVARVRPSRARRAPAEEARPRRGGTRRMSIALSTARDDRRGVGMSKKAVTEGRRPRRLGASCAKGLAKPPRRQPHGHRRCDRLMHHPGAKIGVLIEVNCDRPSPRRTVGP